MATKTVVCPECGDPVTYGRLSCPTCGSLLAAVAGGPVRVSAEPEPEDTELVAPVEAPVSLATPEMPAAPARRAASRAASGGASAVRAAAATARGAAAAVRSAATGTESNGSDVVATAPPVASNGNGAIPPTRPPARRRSVPRPTEPAAPVPPVIGDWPLEPSSFDDSPTNGSAGGPEMASHTIGGSIVPRRGAAPALGERAASLSAALAAPFGASAATDGAPALTWPSQPAGAYLPPSAVFAPKAPGAQAATAIRARQVAPAGPPPDWREGVAWPGQTLDARVGDADPEPTGTPSAPAALLADLPFDVPTTVAGWLIAAGSGVAAVSFLLPWSSNVIGAKGIGTYLDSWGLASPPSFILFALTLGVLALAVVPNNVPVWLRTGLAGLLVGGILVGLIWPYVIGGWADGPQVGVLGELAGGILLIAGGTMAQRPVRHEGDSTGV
ncbi:MAG: hypothetical protein ACJ77B_09560 [Chloroflexota bacterium]